MVVKGLSGMEVVGRGRDLEEGSKQSQAEYGFSKPKRTPRHYMNLVVSEAQTMHSFWFWTPSKQAKRTQARKPPPKQV